MKRNEKQKMCFRIYPVSILIEIDIEAYPENEQFAMEEAIDLVGSKPLIASDCRYVVIGPTEIKTFN